MGRASPLARNIDWPDSGESSGCYDNQIDKVNCPQFGVHTAGNRCNVNFISSLIYLNRLNNKPLLTTAWRPRAQVSDRGDSMQMWEVTCCINYAVASRWGICGANSLTSKQAVVRSFTHVVRRSWENSIEP